MPKILFLRGLNTYADEIQHFGPLKFGAISGPLASYFGPAGLSLLPVPNLGKGTLAEHVANARTAITSLPCWQTEEVFHLVGHSIGGLLARALVQIPEIGERVLSIGTIGTPHHGAQIAEIAAGLENSKPWLQKLLKVADYDTSERAAAFATLSRKSLASFNEQNPDLADVDYFSAVCSLTRTLQALPYRMLHLQLPDFLRHEPSDGMIPASSQKHGRVMGFYELDHMMEVGYCLDVRPKIRRHFQGEFTRMVGDLIRYYQNFGIAPQP